MSNNNHNGNNFNRIMECVAFFGVACIAISLIFAICFQGNLKVFTAFKSVGDAIAYILSIILAGFWVRRQRNIAWLICYVIFVVVIVVMYFMGIFL